jgi:hypothetical protein
MTTALSYKMSSNDYYGALNRRFDARMRKLFKISKRGIFPRMYWNAMKRAFCTYGTHKEVFNTSQVMHMSNRAFYDRMKVELCV